MHDASRNNDIVLIWRARNSARAEMKKRCPCHLRKSKRHLCRLLESVLRRCRLIAIKWKPIFLSIAGAINGLSWRWSWVCRARGADCIRAEAQRISNNHRGWRWRPSLVREIIILLAFVFLYCNQCFYNHVTPAGCHRDGNAKANTRAYIFDSSNIGM